MAKKPPQVPVRVQKLIASLRAGQVICLTFADTADGRSYALEPAGKPVGEWTFRRAVDLGLVAPCRDGLFPDATSQTYRAA